MTNVVHKKIDTASGTLFRPQPVGRQFLALICAVVACPLLSWTIAQTLGDVSKAAKVFLFLPFPLILLIGYSLWLSRLKVIVFDCLGKGLIWAFVRMILFRKVPTDLKSILPTTHTLEKMATRAQEAASSFAWVAVPIGLLAGAVAFCFQTQTTPALQMALVTITCFAWGHLLSKLGRQGFVPVPEEG